MKHIEPLPDVYSPFNPPDFWRQIEDPKPNPTPYQLEARGRFIRGCCISAFATFCGLCGLYFLFVK